MKTVTLNDYAKACCTAMSKWWHDPTTGAPLKRNKAELLALVHTEISECHDGERFNQMDDKLPHRKAGEVELVDAMVRIFDYAGGFGYDLNHASKVLGISEFVGLNHIGGCAQIPRDDKMLLYKRTPKAAAALIHSQISKVVEHERRGRKSEAEIGLVNCLAYISFYGGNMGYQLQAAFVEKMAYNATRKDHTHEARRMADGKQF